MSQISICSPGPELLAGVLVPWVHSFEWVLRSGTPLVVPYVRIFCDHLLSGLNMVGARHMQADLGRGLLFASQKSEGLCPNCRGLIGL